MPLFVSDIKYNYIYIYIYIYNVMNVYIYIHVHVYAIEKEISYTSWDLTQDPIITGFGTALQ